MTKSNGSYTMNSTFKTSEEALAFINANVNKTPMEDMALTGISMYGESRYDEKTHKYDYTTRTYRVTLSWKTPRSELDYLGGSSEGTIAI